MWLKRKLLGYSLRDEDNGDGGEGGGGGGGGEGGKADQGGADANAARLAALEKAIGIVAQSTASMNEAITSLTSKIENIGQQSPKGKQGEAADEDEDVDLETMDRKTYTTWLMRQIKGVVNDSIKPVQENFSKLDEKIDGTSLSIMIKEFQKDHPDFFEWRDEMRALVKENPTLTPARAYALARAENQEKAGKIDDKYGLGKSKKNGETTFTGLFPSTSGGSATKGAGKMNPKAAAEAAWNEVMSSLSSG